VSSAAIRRSPAAAPSRQGRDDDARNPDDEPSSDEFAEKLLLGNSQIAKLREEHDIAENRPST